VRTTELFRTASFHVAVFYAALFSASVLVVFAIIYLSATAYATAQLAGAVEEDLATLETEYRLGGLNNLIAEIVVRLDLREETGRYYLLRASDGRTLAGNAGPLPAEGHWSDFLTADEPRRESHMMAKAVILPDGSYLLAGRSAALLDDLQTELIRAFGWGMAATLVLAILGSMLMSAVSLRRLDAITRVTEDIMGGNLSRRIPTKGTGDEFDRLALQVNRMLDRIEDLMRGLQQVSSDIAHDLKTPLTRLRQRLELARHSAATAEAYASAVDQATAECDQILKTFDAVLRIAQIEAGTRRGGFRPVDLSKLVAGIVETYQPVGEETGHSLTARMAAGARVRGDAQLLTQMLVNLVENALKHTPPGTPVTVSLAAESGGGWRLTVADHGPGIPESDREKVFQRFFRSETSRTTPGSGLGLSLVAAVAQLHDASVALADNHPGLAVTILFPPEG
jgi:signal transduction histidine kinase